MSLPKFRLALTPRGARSPRSRARSARSRARTALVAGVAIYLISQASLHLGIRSGVLPDPDPMYEEKLELLAHRGEVPVLALGSSRVQMAFQAGRFSELTGTTAFNFGTPAAGPLVESLYLRRLLARGGAPKHLILEIHPSFICENQPNFESRWLHLYRLREDEAPLVRKYGWPVETPEHHGWRGWINAAHAYRFSLLNRYAPRWLPCPYGIAVGNANDAHGWLRGPTHMPKEYPKLLGRAFRQYEATFDGYRVGGPGVSALRDIVQVCRERKILVTIILTPESSEYRAWYGPNADAITTFALSLGEPVLDAREWLTNDLFSDGHHLTPDGAAAFTERLAVEWRKLHPHPERSSR